MFSCLLPLLFIVCSVSQAETSPPTQGSTLPPLDRNLLIYLGTQADGFPTGKRALQSCSPTDEPVWAPSACSLIAYLAANAQPAVPAEILRPETRMLYFGETHPSQGTKHFLLQLLPELKARGFSVFAMEMFNSAQQSILDNFAAGKIDLDILRASLQAEWHYEPRGYLDVMVLAKTLGLRFLALDDRKSAPNFPLVDNIHQRDQGMVEILKREFSEHPGVKVFALTGALHAQSLLSQSQAILSQSELFTLGTGIPTRCLTIREHMRIRDPITDLYFRGDTASPAYLPLDRAVAYCDGYILLPKNY